MADPTELLMAHLNGKHAGVRAEGCMACDRLPAVSTPVAPAVRKNNANATSPTTGRKCRCGCGSAVARRFLPGHDAKLKSALVMRARAQDTEAMAELTELGWDHFV